MRNKEGNRSRTFNFNKIGCLKEEKKIPYDNFFLLNLFCNTELQSSNVATEMS